MTAQDVITESRKITGDTSGTRWGSTAVLSAIKDGLHEARRRRPDLWISGPGIMIQPPATLSTSDVLFLSDQYKAALANYVAYRLYLEESDDAANRERALMHYSVFKEAV